MKKLCLILTVLYAFGANCSAQSLNIAENLLTGDNSTFSSMGDWACNDNNACSIASEGGRNGNYLKLTNTGAGNGWDKQMEYSLSGHTPANGKRYVIKFWARKVSGSGEIKVLLQKNNESEEWPQKEFNGNPFTVSNDWTPYAFDITTDRGDYEVIKINFGNCGEVWIDDIEYGEYTDHVTGSILVEGLTLTAPDAMNVGTNALCNLIITPDNATNKNVIWDSSAPSIIEVDQNGKLTAKSTGTATITVSSQDGGQQVSKEIKVNASTSTNGTVVDGGMFYMVQDFGNATVNATWEIIHSDQNIKEHGSATIVADPAGQKGNVLRYEAANNDKTEFLVFDCVLPAGKKLSDYSNLVFDYKMSAVGEAN